VPQGRRIKVKTYGEAFEIAKDVTQWCRDNGFVVKKLVDSPMRGKSAEQIEFFVWLGVV